MKKIFKTLLILGTITIFSTTAFSQFEQFVGTFKNTDGAASNIAKIEIKRNGKNFLVQVWGKCSPSDCDWGVEDGFGYTDSTNSARTISVIYRKSFADTILMVRSLAGNRLDVEASTRFTDTSGRANYSRRETFMKDSEQTSLNEDCLPYNPQNLQIKNEGASGWLLTDGSSRMLILDNEADAKNALAMAKRHTSHCFIGRGNNRSNRQNYIVNYWKGDSGIRTNIINEDCISYDSNRLAIKNEGAGGWLLTDGNSRMLMVASREDATLAKQIAGENSKQCFIGRSNSRPNRQSYITNYWR